MITVLVYRLEKQYDIARKVQKYSKNSQRTQTRSVLEKAGMFGTLELKERIWSRDMIELNEILHRMEKNKVFLLSKY